MIFDENGTITEEGRAKMPEILGDDWYNDPQTKQQPTKALDNIKDVSGLLKAVVNGTRKISSHSEEIKKATEGLVKIPGENATKEEIAAYRKATGMPDKPEDYKFNIPKTDNELDKKSFELVAEAIKPAAFEEGVPPSKLNKIFEKVVNVLAQQNEEITRKGRELLEADIKSLKDKYKDKYDSFVKSGDDGLSKFDYKDNPIGTNFKNLMENYGILDAPAVREFLHETSKLVLSDDSHLVNNPTVSSEDSWPVDYKQSMKS